MTVNSTARSVIYQGNGSTRIWPFAFRVLQKSDLVVTLITGDVETTVSQADFTATALPAYGGSITYPIAGYLATGTSIRIERVVDLKQTTEFENQGGYFARSIEAGLDRVTMAQQQLQDQIDALPAEGGVPTTAFSQDFLLSASAGSALNKLGISNFLQIAGLTLSNNIALPDVAVDVASGTCTDKTGVVTMNLTVAITKRLNALWAAGSGNGGLDVATSVGSTSYNFFLIYNPATQAVDGLFSTSFNNPVMPVGYTLSRYIGTVITNGAGAITPFLNVGERFRLKTPILDVNAPNSSGVNIRVLSLPRGPKSRALIRANCSGTGMAFLYFRDPDLGAYSVVDTTAARNFRDPAGGNFFIDTFEVETDNLGRIQTSSTSVVLDEAIVVHTVGWAVDRSIYR